MAPFFSGIAGAIKGQAGFGFGRRAGISRVLVQTISTFTSPGSLPVPGATTAVTIIAHGARGTPGYPTGGTGGYVQGTFANLSGKTLNISIAGRGEAPSGPFNYRGGNYAGVFDGPVTHANSLMIAGGGGGSGGAGSSFVGPGGAGGGTTGASGSIASPAEIFGPGTPGTPGGGGTQSAGGTVGTNGSPISYPFLSSATSGSALQGGAGSMMNPDTWFFLGQTNSGGGGGGYYGGGGGGNGYAYDPNYKRGAAAGGGGGSSYIHPTATSTTNTQGGSTQPDGYVEIQITELI